MTTLAVVLAFIVVNRRLFSSRQKEAVIARIAGPTPREKDPNRVADDTDGGLPTAPSVTSTMLSTLSWAACRAFAPVRVHAERKLIAWIARTRLLPLRGVLVIVNRVPSIQRSITIVGVYLVVALLATGLVSAIDGFRWHWLAGSGLGLLLASVTLAAEARKRPPLR